MTVYVDEVRNYAGRYHGIMKTQAERVGSRSGHRWSHLFTDQQDQTELHEMAARIGLKRSWHQGDHYDVVPSKRAAAVKHGAVETTCEEAAMILVYDRMGRERPTYGRGTETTDDGADFVY